MKNYIQPGSVLSLLAAAAVQSGEAVLVGKIFGSAGLELRSLVDLLNGAHRVAHQFQHGINGSGTACGQGGVLAQGG